MTTNNEKRTKRRMIVEGAAIVVLIVTLIMLMRLNARVYELEQYVDELSKVTAAYIFPDTTVRDCYKKMAAGTK